VKNLKQLPKALTEMIGVFHPPTIATSDILLVWL